MFRSVILVLLGLLALCCSAAGPNNIKVGNARLTVSVDSPDSVSIGNAAVWVETAPVFCDFFDTQLYKLEKEGNVFSGEIPLELKEEIVGLRFECDGKGFGYMATLYQDKPVHLTFKINGDYAFMECESSDEHALSPDEWQLYNTVYMRFVAPEVVNVVPTELYDSWEKVRAYENTVMYPEQLKYALDGVTLPEDTPAWFINNLKCRFASINTIPYVKGAEKMNNITVDEPPMRSYSFLDSIDYSPVFLTRMPYTGLKSFIYALLRFPEGGFGKIGETPVGQWQDKVREKMLPAISNPTQLLLDLLAAMSYVEQIEINRQPLSAVQIANVMAGFPDNDLDKIIIEKNDRLMAMADQSGRQDLSALSFDMQQYVDKMYPGRLVVVDLWNTWCGPCLDAINKTEIIRKELPDSDIVFLFISDESSGMQEWERYSSGINGVNLRLSKEDSMKIGEKYNLTGFPSYIFFNRDHDAVHSQTAFPGISEYKKWLEVIAATDCQK